jgi:methylation protein EvaC
MSFGKMPIANGFLEPEDFETESFFDLQVGFCSSCGMVQLTQLIEPVKLFHGNYAYFSSISNRMSNHFKEFADSVREDYLTDDNPFVVEIGSNDGIMLKHFANAGIRHLGVEPSANVAQVAINQGINTTCRFFNETAAMEIREEYGRADIVLGANVVCHLPDIHSVMNGIKQLLTDEGLFMFEEPYLGDIFQKASYDQIYDEHVFYFSLHSLKNLLARHEMEIIDVAPQNVHGGSMRYTVSREGLRSVAPIVSDFLAMERRLGVLEPAAFDALRQRIYGSRDDLVGLLNELKKQGKRIAGYGATSKSTTVINFCGLGPDLIEFISDTTPGKQGKYSPGAHIPVLPYESFKKNYPDYALLFAWNHADEIIENERAFREQGGQFILYIPEVAVI